MFTVLDTTLHFTENEKKQFANSSATMPQLSQN